MHLQPSAISVISANLFGLIRCPLTTCTWFSALFISNERFAVAGAYILHFWVAAKGQIAHRKK